MTRRSLGARIAVSIGVSIGGWRSYTTAIEHRRALIRRGLGLLLGLLVLGTCQAGQPPAPGVLAGTTAVEAQEPQASRLWMSVGERRFAITLSDNAAARAFAAQLPLTLEMDELNGNEKKADLPQALPVNASRPGTLRNGDLMLYGSKTLVVFYLTFDSAYSYTRLGRVDDPDSLALALGQRGVRVVFSRDQ